MVNWSQIYTTHGGKTSDFDPNRRSHLTDSQVKYWVLELFWSNVTHVGQLETCQNWTFFNKNTQHIHQYTKTTKIL